MTGVYVLPGDYQLIGGLVIYYAGKVLMGKRQGRAEAGKWCLPTGRGAFTGDLTEAVGAELVAAGMSPGLVRDQARDCALVILKNPEAQAPIQLSPRVRIALRDSAGFAFAESLWYVWLPLECLSALIPLPVIANYVEEETKDGTKYKLITKMYFALEWPSSVPPPPASSEVSQWPFVKTAFYTKEQLKGIPIAFGCDEDLDQVFWPWLKKQHGFWSSLWTRLK